VYKKIVAAVSAAMLLTGVAVGIAAPAEAHTPAVSATCQAGLTVDLTNYSASQPGQDAVAPVYKDWDENVVTDPGSPAVPAVPAVPTTYVQEWEFAQKITGHISWHEENWNPGKGWDKTGNHRDTTAVLVQGHDAIPGKDAVPPTINVVHHHDLVTPGKDAVPAKTNHVTATDNGTTIIDTDFSTTFSKTVPSTDKTIAHDYVVTVSSLDGIGAGTWNKHVDACEVVVVPPKTVTINPVVINPPTCDSALTYVVPEQDSHVKYTLVNGVRPVPGTFTLGAGQDLTIGAHVEAQYTSTGEYAPANYSVTIHGADSLANTQDCAVKPDNITKHVHTEGTPNCTLHEVPVWDATLENEAVWNAETHKYEFLDANWQKVSGEESTRKTTDKECPAVVVVTPPTNKPVASAPVTTVPPVQSFVASSDDQLAHTGSDISVLAWFLGIGLLSVGAVFLFIRGLQLRRQANQH
jgi:hypothetical protein